MSSSEMTPWWKLLPLVISNFAFILPAVRALQYKRILSAFIYFSVTLASSLYHLCKVDSINEPGEGGICFVLLFDQHHHLDFFFAYLNVPLTAMYFIPFNAIVDKITGKIIRMPFYWVEQWIMYTYALVLALAIQVFEEQGDTRVIASFIISVLLVVIIFWLQNYFQYNVKPSFDWIDLTVAIIITLISVALISSQKFVTGDIYWITHSIWHVGGAVGQFYFLDSRNKEHSGIHMFTPWISDLKTPLNKQPTTMHKERKMIPIPLPIINTDNNLITQQEQHLNSPNLFSYQNTQQVSHPSITSISSISKHSVENNLEGGIEGLDDINTITYYDNFIDNDTWMIPGHSIWTLFQWALPPYLPNY